MTKEQIKELYSFEIKTTKEVEETTTNVDPVTNEETKVIRKVKKEVPVRIVIARPNRRVVESAELQFSVKLSELMKLGLMTRAMVTKKYADTGGVLTEEEAKYLTSRYKRLAEVQNDFARLAIKIDNLSEEQKKDLDKVTNEINDLRREIATIESNYSFIFQHTADMKATNHVILFYSLMLTNIEEQKDGAAPVYTPFFKGVTFEDKLNDYYEKEESGDSFYTQVKHKLAYFLSFWYNGAIATREDFVKLEKEIDEGLV